jgi:small conductance mechanosensitive channel
VDLFGHIKLVSLLYALALIVFGFILSKSLSMTIAKLIEKNFSKHQAMIVKRITYYLFLTLFFIAALQQLGFKLSVLIGAAGIFTLAISFASQTAISNLISGVFLLFEQPFKVGDTISVKGYTGIVDSIDLLSTKLKTFDNQLVRLPNEGLIKSEVTNLSYFPIRRCDLIVSVAYDSDIKKAKSILSTIATNQQYSLNEPRIKIIVKELADSAINLRLSVWVKTENFSTLKSELMQDILIEFEKNNIEIPYPQLTIHKE